MKRRPGNIQARAEANNRPATCQRAAAVDEAAPRDALAGQRCFQESAERTAVPGVATGLAGTGTGGDVLFIEASLADPETGATGVTLTGQLGDVIKGSAHIALAHPPSHAAQVEPPAGSPKNRVRHL